MSYVASLLERWIGPDSAFATQKVLADQAGIRPSTLNGTLKAQSVQPETLGKLLSCLTRNQQEQLIAAAVRDAIPESFIDLVLKGETFILKDEAMIATLSPVAQRTLNWLNKQAARDNEAQAWLEQLGRWVGLDKEMD